jgi:hypothetical protein
MHNIISKPQAAVLSNMIDRRHPFHRGSSFRAPKRVAGSNGWSARGRQCPVRRSEPAVERLQLAHVDMEASYRNIVDRIAFASRQCRREIAEALTSAPQQNASATLQPTTHRGSVRAAHY